jgi:hypothetical protein
MRCQPGGSRGKVRLESVSSRFDMLEGSIARLSAASESASATLECDRDQLVERTPETPHLRSGYGSRYVANRAVPSGHDKRLVPPMIRTTNSIHECTVTSDFGAS